MSAQAVRISERVYLEDFLGNLQVALGSERAIINDGEEYLYARECM